MTLHGAPSSSNVTPGRKSFDVMFAALTTRLWRPWHLCNGQILVVDALLGAVSLSSAPIACLRNVKVSISLSLSLYITCAVWGHQSLIRSPPVSYAGRTGEEHAALVIAFHAST